MARLGQQVCRTPEEFEAWSQNFGHEQVMMTLASYGKVESYRQTAIFDELRRSRPSGDP